jgi:enoyl-CoA hydratase/carnithine racemase
MAEKVIRYETDDKIGIISFDRADKLNAISKDVREQLTAAFIEADLDETTSVVVLRGEGRAFCVGYDLTGGEPDKDPWRNDAIKWHFSLKRAVEFEMMPWYMRKPVIASVQGHAVGAGCEIAMFCDLTIAAEDAKFGEPEIRFSEAGPAIVAPHIIGYKRARELLYFGDLIDAKTAMEYGMVNRIVPAAELAEYTMKYARRLALVAPEALVATKQAITRGADTGGFRNAMMAGLDAVAPLYAAKTESGMKFVEIARNQDLKAALAWRNGQFKE